MTLMSSMSVFNEWDAQASQRGLERAAEKISGAFDKGVGKITTDMQKNADKIAAATKAGSERIVDAVGKIKPTQNANQSNAVSAVVSGLHSVAESANIIADHVIANPADLGAVATSAKAVGQQFTNLLDATTQFAQDSDLLWKTTAEVEKAAGWLGNNYPGGSVPVNNAGRVVHSFNELWQ